MSFSDDLLRRGYLPENLPAAFDTGGIAEYFSETAPRGYLSRSREPVRSATYNASKRGSTRRTFSVVHPMTCYDLSRFMDLRWEATQNYWQENAEAWGDTATSLSVPRRTPDGDRAIEIGSHNELEKVRNNRLSKFRFIAKTDISRFYHAIYTHSIPWAFHGKSLSKLDRLPQSSEIFFNRADYILRCGQDGQTIGIPVGPDASRIIAEIVSTAIDAEFRKRCRVRDFEILRHVDDVWIGANTHADAENALWRYREAIREYELDINETKTQIYSENFRFSDGWPSEIASKFEFAMSSGRQHAPERLRAAFEFAFSMAVDTGDDGILKYVIRLIDQSHLKRTHWEDVEPFLKRAAVHFGHTIDYVIRVVIWRHLTQQDLDHKSWSNILRAILNQHGRIGNDSEVCWAIYACIRLRVYIPIRIAERILENCGALSAVAILNCIEQRLVRIRLFDQALELVQTENASGPFWPIILEWKSRQWPNHRALNVENELIAELANEDIVIFNADRLPPVFDEADNFTVVSRAIERRVSYYDDESEFDLPEWDADLDPELPF